jgi:hypothetical protein
MALYLGYATTEESKKSNRRNSVLVVAASENVARRRAEIVAGFAENELGSVASPAGWRFIQLTAQEGFFEGNFIAADLKLATFANQGA